MSGSWHEDFDRLGERLVVVFRHLGLPIEVEGGFQLSVLVPEGYKFRTFRSESSDARLV